VPPKRPMGTTETQLPLHTITSRWITRLVPTEPGDAAQSRAILKKNKTNQRAPGEDEGLDQAEWWQRWSRRGR